MNGVMMWIVLRLSRHSWITHKIINMARRLLFFVLFIILTGCSCTVAMAQYFTIEQHIDTTFASTLEGKGSKAMVVGIIKGDQKMVLNFGAEPATEETIYDLGSITKVFTGVALSKAIVEGALAPETSICELDPELFGERNTLCVITVADVATHRSGLPRMPVNLDAFGNIQNPFANYSEEKLKEYVTEWDGYEEKEHDYTSKWMALVIWA